jgi:hypothetical protein
MVSSTLWIYTCFQGEWELIDRKFVTTYRVDFKEWKLDSQRKKKGNGSRKNKEKIFENKLEDSEDSEVLEELERALERQIEEEEEENIGLDQAMEEEEDEEEEVEEEEVEDHEEIGQVEEKEEDEVIKDLTSFCDGC